MVFCCKSCLESCYWHLIEKRFCYDEDIALYEEPEAQEKNNNFENLAFYDSIAIIAKGAILNDDYIPPATPAAIVQQPKARHNSSDRENQVVLNKNISKSVSSIYIDNLRIEDSPPSISCSDTTLNTTIESKKDMLEVYREGELKKKSLAERRNSKQLYLKIDKKDIEIPIIRQDSMPKFFLEVPGVHQIESTLVNTPSITLTSPVPANDLQRTKFDLSSVVQMEKEKSYNALTTVTQTHQEKVEKNIFRDKIVNLRRVKSSLSAFQSNH